jgi:hypothetical protein
MKEAISSYETSLLTRATRCNIQEDTIIHSHRLENLKSYIYVSYFTTGCYVRLTPPNLLNLVRITIFDELLTNQYYDYQRAVYCTAYIRT